MERKKIDEVSSMMSGAFQKKMRKGLQNPAEERKEGDFKEKDRLDPFLYASGKIPKPLPNSVHWRVYGHML